MKTFNHLLSLFLIVLVVVASDISQAIATPVLTFNETTGGSGANNDQSVGWQFNLVSPITVTDVGWFDEGRNGHPRLSFVQATFSPDIGAGFVRPTSFSISREGFYGPSFSVADIIPEPSTWLLLGSGLGLLALKLQNVPNSLDSHLP
jgi:PEP-CTERM motif-containing protein